MSSVIPIYWHDDKSPFIFNCYSYTDLVDFKDDRIHLHMNNYHKAFNFKILVDYDCFLITKKYNDYHNIMGNYHNIVSPERENIQQLEITEESLKFKNYYSNLDDYEELRKLNKLCHVHTHHTVKWKNYKLDIWTWIPIHICTNMAYIISDSNNHIISVMLCNELFQLGSCKTYVYLISDKHILIYNAGDIYSTIVIQDLIN